MPPVGVLGMVQVGARWFEMMAVQHVVEAVLGLGLQPHQFVALGAERPQVADVLRRHPDARE